MGEKRAFLSHVIWSRWFTVFGSVLIMSMNGSTYLFGAYSSTIKSSLGYDQTTLNLISFFKDLGANLGIISGLINEITPPWVVLAIGGVMNLIGYLVIWLAVGGRIARPTVWQMCLYIFIGSDSQAFATTGSLITSVKNFPDSRGIVLGLLKGFVGLSGAILTQFFHAFHGGDSLSLILLIAWLPAAVSFVFLPTIRIIRVSERENDIKIFYEILYLSLALAAFLMAITIVENRVMFQRIDYVGSASVVIILLFIPLAIIVKQELQEWKNNNTNPAPQIQETKSPSSISQPPTNREEKIASFLKNALNPPPRGEDYTILQALFSIDMAILFIATSCGIGGTLTAIDNLGQIAESLRYNPNTITTFVSLMSTWNYLGRVSAGSASEILLTKFKYPRPLMLAFILLISCSGHLLIAFPGPNSLYVASVIIGFCSGAEWPLIFAIISEIFGLKYYSTLYQFGSVASPVGVYVFNVRVAGRLYDREAMRQMAAAGVVRGSGQDLSCLGRECFKLSFVIITAATFFGCLVSLVLVVRTWAFYKGDVCREFGEDLNDSESVI